MSSSFAIENVSVTQTVEQNQNSPQTASPKPGNSQTDTQAESLSWNNRAVPIMSRFFVWVGFIISIGLTAKILTTFNDQKVGLLTVIFVGCIGALVSMIVLPRLCTGGGFQPVSPIGFIVAVIVAFLMLLSYSKFRHFFEKGNN